MTSLIVAALVVAAAPDGGTWTFLENRFDHSRPATLVTLNLYSSCRAEVGKTVTNADVITALCLCFTDAQLANPAYSLSQASVDRCLADTVVMPAKEPEPTKKAGPRKPLISTAPVEEPVRAEPIAKEDDDRTRKVLGAVAVFLSGLGGRSTMAPAAADEGCSSDFQCGSGKICVKDQFKMRGVCATAVNQYGNPTLQGPRLDSLNPGGEGQCSFNTDCPIGFECRKSSGSLSGHCFKR